MAKFIGREKTRSGLLSDQDALRRKRSDLDAELKRLSGPVSEMQHSLAQPMQTEAALRSLDPKLTKAAGI